MTKPKTVRISLPDGPVDAEIGPDVDLGTEAIYDRNGRRYDDGYVAEIVEGAREELARRGRPSLTGQRGTSPVLQVRVSASLKRKIARRAKEEGKPQSEVTRDALERYFT